MRNSDSPTKHSVETFDAIACAMLLHIYVKTITAKFHYLQIQRPPPNTQRLSSE